MRELFASEQRCVRNLLTEELHIESPQLAPHVAEEYYCEPRVQCKGPRFNIDFILRFVSRHEMPSNRRAGGSPVLPNTIGADIFLLVEKETDRPLLLHLIAGEAFPMKYFKRHIATVEERLTAIISGFAEHVTHGMFAAALKNAVPVGRLLRDVCVRRSAYCRLLVIGGDACFLFFPTLVSPEMRGVRHTLLDSDAGRIDCYVDGSEIVCFDGWLPVNVVDSEWKLEAIWKDDVQRTDLPE